MKLKFFRLTITICIVFVSQSFAQSNTLNVDLNQGKGYFNFQGGVGHEDDTIKVYYNKPKNFTSNSKILLVIPGAGRNADDYRDSWVEASEKHSVLIISPSYAEKNYDFGDYHLGGLVKDLDQRKGIKFEKGSNRVHMDENVIEFILNTDSKQWIYNDFDRLFDVVTKSVGSSQKGYDIFGHSAGGQILHRFALFAPNSKANRILASNSGSYTLPNNSKKFPFGIERLDLTKKKLKQSFKKKLILFLGEMDNENESGGLILRSVTMDEQGTHRFARGNYFYKNSKQIAKINKSKFNWELEVVPNVGHNQRKMARAAAIFLYGNNN